MMRDNDYISILFLILVLCSSIARYFTTFIDFSIPIGFGGALILWRGLFLHRQEKHFEKVYKDVIQWSNEQKKGLSLQKRLRFSDLLQDFNAGNIKTKKSVLEIGSILFNPAGLTALSARMTGKKRSASLHTEIVAMPEWTSNLSDDGDHFASY